MTDWLLALLSVSAKAAGAALVFVGCSQLYELFRLRKAWPFDED